SEHPVHGENAEVGVRHAYARAAPSPILERRTCLRTQTSLTKKATQNTTAMDAVTMKFTGDTSQDVSATIRPNAKQLNMIAKKIVQSKPRSNRCVRLRALA